MDIARLQQLSGFSEFERQTTALVPALDALRIYERHLRDLLPSIDPVVSELARLQAAHAALTGSGFDRASEAVGLQYLGRVADRIGLVGLDGARSELARLVEAQLGLDALTSPRLRALELLQRQVGFALEQWDRLGAWFSRGDIDLAWVVERASYWNLIDQDRHRGVAADVGKIAPANFFGARGGPPKPRKFQLTRTLRSVRNRQTRVAVCFVQSLQTFLMRHNLFGDRFGLSIEVAHG